MVAALFASGANVMTRSLKAPCMSNAPATASWLAQMMTKLRSSGSGKRRSRREHEFRRQRHADDAEGLEPPIENDIDGVAWTHDARMGIGGIDDYLLGARRIDPATLNQEEAVEQRLIGRGNRDDAARDREFRIFPNDPYRLGDARFHHTDPIDLADAFHERNRCTFQAGKEIRETARCDSGRP